MDNKFYRYQAFPCFLAILSFYILLIIYLDNTNITTTNGFYKSIDVNGWETSNKFAVDSGGLLYAFSMGMICKLISNSLVSFYGEIANFVTYRKLAWINSFFGAASCSVVFTLAYQVTKDKFWAVCVTLLHAFSAFILINSIISEDIIPGYFFFTLSFFFIYKALEGKNIRAYLTASTLSVIAMMLLHWTLFLPVAATYFIIVCFLGYQDRFYVRLFIEQLVIFLIIIFTFTCVANFGAGNNVQKKLSIFRVIFPNKAGGSWVGFSWYKVMSVYEGVGNYLVGGKNVQMPFSGDISQHLRNMVSWLATFISLALLSISFLKEKKRELRVLALFGLCIFFFGEAQTLYGSPYDPQFQIQPMFLITIGGISAYFLFAKKNSIRHLKALFLTFIFMVGIDNLMALQSFRTGDSVMVSGYKEFRQHFPKSTTKIVHLGYEGWGSWLMLFDYQGDFKIYLNDVTCLNTPFHLTPGITAEEGAQQIMKDIDDAIGKGKKVIAATPWVYAEHIHELCAQNLTREQTSQLKKILLENYQVKATYKLKWGEFAEIEKRKSNG